MLEQVRTETPRRLVPQPPGVTDARIFRVSVEACKYNLVLSRSNTPPQLPPLPIQYGDELSELVVTNLVTGPDADYGLHAFTFGAEVPAGMSMDPDDGLIRWTPTEAQGPSTNEITVVATAIASPKFRTTNVVTLVIREVNQSPTLLPDRRLQGSDVGHPPDPGFTTYRGDGSIEVVASGFGTYWGDDFHFSHEQIEGDFDIGVQVEALESAARVPAAGIMARASLDFDSPFVAAYLMASGNYAWWVESRAATGPAYPELWPNGAGGPLTRFPTWLRLQRRSQVFRVFRSEDGSSWQQVSGAVSFEG